jgi:hypothetical protein
MKHDIKPFDVFYGIADVHTNNDNGIIEVPENLRQKFFVEAMADASKIAEAILLNAVNGGQIDVTKPISQSTLKNITKMAEMQVAYNIEHMSMRKRQLKKKLREDAPSGLVVPH